MASAFRRAEAAGRPFGERLLAALKAGQAAGGDRRGRQGAGMLIVKKGGGYGGGDDIYADLHVEDSPEPILELERVYNVWMSTFHAADHFLPGGSQPFAAPSGAHVCALRNLLAKAGQAAGGDRRGRQGAGMLIVKKGGGYGGGDDIYADLHVEDSPEPILELERVYNVWMSTFHAADHFLPGGSQPFAAPSGAHVCALRNLLAKAGHGTATTQGFCAFDDEVIAALKAFQRAQNLPVSAALTPQTAERLRQVAGARP
jgi:uncharacterized Ntn-hydrolase superfamily protein